jgi:large subunit ribosomal protein L21
MSYAIISVGGKQYRVREGERLLVDRLELDDGATFAPPVLLSGGDGDAQVAPAGVVVTAKVVAQAKGPKLRIGKYKKRTGYKRHTGFRASLTQIEIESIGGTSRRQAAKEPAHQKAAPETAATEAGAPAETAGGLPAGYADLTIAELKQAATGWDAAELAAALDYEKAHAKRKGALAALESAISEAES